jgi:hypothetical protein
MTGEFPGYPSGRSSFTGTASIKTRQANKNQKNGNDARYPKSIFEAKDSEARVPERFTARKTGFRGAFQPSLLCIMESWTRDRFRGKFFGFITIISPESRDSYCQAAVAALVLRVFLFFKGEGFGFVLFFEDCPPSGGTLMFLLLALCTARA